MTSRDSHRERSTVTATAPARVALPPLAPATPEEIACRRALFARVMARRSAIGPIGIRTDELVHQSRVEADAADR